MTRAEVAKLFTIMKIVYPNFEVDEMKVTVWHDFLKDFPFDEAQINLRRHIDFKAFPPTIAEIKRLSEKERDQERINHLLLKEETNKRLAIMEEWKAKASPPPWLREGGKRPYE